MERAQAAADPARGSPQHRSGSRTVSPMQVTSVVERNESEPQLDNGPFSRPWPFPTPQPPRLHGPSALESKVRALKEKMTADKQGVSPTTHEQSSPKKSKCRRVRPGRVRISEGSSLSDAVVVPYAQNLTGEQLDSSVNKEEPTHNGASRPSRLYAPELGCWNGQGPLPPEAVWVLLERERCLPPGPDSLPESPIHRITPGWPAGPGPYKVTCKPGLKKGRPDPLQDGLVTAGDLDSTSLMPEEAFVPRTGLQGALWKARDLGAPGTGSNALSLSDQVEKNRLLLQEMLKVSGQSPSKVAPPAWNRTAPERPAGDVGWESGIFLQDSEQNRTFGPKPEAMLSTSNEDAKHLLQRARVKARTRPLRASHDIVPAITQGSRAGRRSPAPGPRMTSTCGESLQSGSLSDSSSGESSSGQWPKQGMSPSHVRFEDESACEAEFRHLERLQQRQRQRQVLSTVLQAVGQGPLHSKPDLADYVNREVGMGAFHRPGDSVDSRAHPLPPPHWASKKKCQACGSCPESQRLDPAVLEELQAAYGVKGVLPGSHSSHGLSSPCWLLPAEPRLHTERIRETHIGEPTTCPEEGDCALDSTDTSDSCLADSEEAGTALPSRAGRRTQGSSPGEWDFRPQGSLRWSRQAKMELLCGLQAWRHLGVDGMEVGDEVKEAAGHRPMESPFLKEDAVSQPPPLEPEMASLGSQRQPGPELGRPRAHPVDSRAPCKPAYATPLSMQLAPSAPGRPENHEYLETVCTSSLKQNHPQPAAPDPTQQPATASSPEGLVPTRTTSPAPHRKAGLAGPCRSGEQEEPVGIPLPLSPPRTVVLRTCGLSPSQSQPCIPQVRHPPLGPSANSCNSGIPLGQQEPWQTAAHRGSEEREPCSQELDPPLESVRDGGCQGSVDLADAATFSSMGITLSLASEEPESCQEPRGGLQRTESSSGGPVLSGASPGASAGPRPPSAAPSDRNKKRSSSIASTLGLKKLFSALGQTSRPKLGKSRSYSVEQLQPDAPGLASRPSTPQVKRAPSLQSLNPVSPSRQHRKAASFQNLHSLLSGRGDRSSLYLVESPGCPSAPGRPAKVPPRRTLSVEDVGAPSLARTVGRVVAVFPDGTSELQLQRSPEGTFGFRVGSGNGRRDSEGEGT
uniref:KIAA1614 n=1 Tax=Chinchilla lanigera TaxID=34839 RepID=A0A8C2VSL5_CHILA